MAPDRLTDEALSELERLEREATPGPWESYRADGEGHVLVMAEAITSPGKFPSHMKWSCDFEGWDPGWDDEEPTPAQREQAAEAQANANLLPAMRNALPSLLSEVRSSRAVLGADAGRCKGHCHCHAGADGLMHPPCCEDCAPGADAGLRERVLALADEMEECADSSLDLPGEEWAARLRALASPGDDATAPRQTTDHDAQEE